MRYRDFLIAADSELSLMQSVKGGAVNKNQNNVIVGSSGTDGVNGFKQRKMMAWWSSWRWLGTVSMVAGSAMGQRRLSGQYGRARLTRQARRVRCAQVSCKLVARRAGLGWRCNECNGRGEGKGREGAKGRRGEGAAGPRREVGQTRRRVQTDTAYGGHDGWALTALTALMDHGAEGSSEGSGIAQVRLLVTWFMRPE